MPDISLVNIEELTSTSSKDVGLLIPIALPSGGSSYVIRQISKEDLLKLSGQQLDFDVAGSTDILTFSNAGGSYKLIYFGLAASSTTMWTTIQHGIGDGTTYAASLTRSGTAGQLQLRDADGQSSFTKKNLSQLFKEANLNNASTVTSEKARVSVLKVLPNAGSIAAGDIQFPQSPSDGDCFKFYVDGTITSLTLTTAPGAETIDTTIATITDGGAEYYYQDSDTEWKQIATW